MPQARRCSVIGSCGRCGEAELLQVSQMVGGHEPNTRHPHPTRSIPNPLDCRKPPRHSLSPSTHPSNYRTHTYTMASRALSMPARRVAARLSTPAMTRRSFQSSARLLEVPVGAMPVRKPVGAFRGGYGDFLFFYSCLVQSSGLCLYHLPTSASSYRLPKPRRRRVTRTDVVTQTVSSDSSLEQSSAAELSTTMSLTNTAFPTNS